MLILASTSPQRAAILEQLGVAFEAVPAGVDEVAQGRPADVARENARRKARQVAAARPDATVVGADTVVALDERILPKPADEGQAVQWLRALSGRTHRVVGGVCVVRAGAERDAVAVTAVTFRDLTDAEVAWYVDSGEWRERAGAYAIQGRGGALVDGIEGEYLNVVGLPVAALLNLVPGLLAPAGR